MPSDTEEMEADFDFRMEPESLRKIFIGGLDYDTTDETLEAYFEQWGDIVDVVVMKNPITKKSRGFGFITYSHSAMVDEAMSHRPHKINGREVETKRAVPRDEMAKAASNALNVKKIFVGGLREHEEIDLQDYFTQFGNVTSVCIILNRDTGAKRGFAFVEFDDHDAVDKIVLQRDHVILGTKLFIKKALEWEEVRRNESRRGGRGRSSFRGGFSRGGRRSRDFEDSGFRRGRRDFSRDDRDFWDDDRDMRGGRRDFSRDRMDDLWDDRGSRRDFRDEWESGKGRRFRDSSLDRDFGDDGFGRNDRFGGGPIRSSFSGRRNAPYESFSGRRGRGRRF